MQYLLYGYSSYNDPWEYEISDDLNKWRSGPTTIRVGMNQAKIGSTWVHKKNKQLAKGETDGPDRKIVKT